MKKIMAICMALVLLLSLSACNGKQKDEEKNAEKAGISEQDDAYIQKAVKRLNESWAECFSTSPEKTEELVEIIDTRLIYIKDNDVEMFKDVEAVVEFELFTDYFGSSPYYSNVQQRDTVTFHKNGEIGVGLDVFGLYRASTYNTDFSDIIEKIVECGTAYNTNFIKKDKASKKDKEYVEEALNCVRSGWSDFYDEYSEEISSRDIRIINTKLMYVNDETTYKYYDQYFDGVEVIVEFEIHSNYYGSAPYYDNTGRQDTVLFYKNGKTEVQDYYMSRVRSVTYDPDFSDLFSKIVELGDAYNQTIAC